VTRIGTDGHVRLKDPDAWRELDLCKLPRPRIVAIRALNDAAIIVPKPIDIAVSANCGEALSPHSWNPLGPAGGDDLNPVQIHG